MYVSCHRPFLPGTSLEPALIPTAQASSFTLSTFRSLLLLLLLLYDMYVSCHRHFFLVLLLNQRWSSPLRLQASRCSTFRLLLLLLLLLLLRAAVLLGKLRVAHHNHFYKSANESINNPKSKVKPNTQIFLQVPEWNFQRTHKNCPHVVSLFYPVCLCV